MLFTKNYKMGFKKTFFVFLIISANLTLQGALQEDLEKLKVGLTNLKGNLSDIQEKLNFLKGKLSGIPTPPPPPPMPQPKEHATPPKEKPTPQADKPGTKSPTFLQEIQTGMKLKKASDRKLPEQKKLPEDQPSLSLTEILAKRIALMDDPDEKLTMVANIKDVFERIKYLANLIGDLGDEEQEYEADWDDDQTPTDNSSLRKKWFELLISCALYKEKLFIEVTGKQELIKSIYENLTNIEEFIKNKIKKEELESLIKLENFDEISSMIKQYKTKFEKEIASKEEDTPKHAPQPAEPERKKPTPQTPPRIAPKPQPAPPATTPEEQKEAKKKTDVNLIAKIDALIKQIDQTPKQKKEPKLNADTLEKEIFDRLKKSRKPKSKKLNLWINNPKINEAINNLAGHEKTLAKLKACLEALRDPSAIAVEKTHKKKKPVGETSEKEPELTRSFREREAKQEKKKEEEAAAHKKLITEKAEALKNWTLAIKPIPQIEENDLQEVLKFLSIQDLQTLKQRILTRKSSKNKKLEYEAGMFEIIEKFSNK